MYRIFSFIACMAALPGCLTPQSSAVVDSVRRVVSDRMPVELDRAKAAQSGLGLLGLRLDDRPMVYLGLDSIHPDRYVLNFVSTDGAYVQLYNGQVRGTHRLGADMLNLKPLADDPFESGFKTIHPARTYYWELVAPDSVMHAVVETRYVSSVDVEVETLHGKWSTTLITEFWEIPAIEYVVENRYWIDQDGIVIRSEQAPLPDLPRFELVLESYKPSHMR